MVVYTFVDAVLARVELWIRLSIIARGLSLRLNAERDSG
jgi:hypothetical protein